MELANMVCDHIKDLMMELKVLNREINRRNSLEEQPSTSGSGSSKGFLLDRYVKYIGFYIDMFYILQQCNFFYNILYQVYKRQCRHHSTHET